MQDKFSQRNKNFGLRPGLNGELPTTRRHFAEGRFFISLKLEHYKENFGLMRVYCLHFHLKLWKIDLFGRKISENINY